MKSLRIIQFWLFLAFCSYLSLTPALPQTVLLFSDKLLHTIGYLALYLSCSLAYPLSTGSRRKVLLLLGYSVLIEVIQHFIPNRGFSLLDILANAVGLLCGLALIRFFGKRPPYPKTP